MRVVRRTPEALELAWSFGFIDGFHAFFGLLLLGFASAPAALIWLIANDGGLAGMLSFRGALVGAFSAICWAVIAIMARALFRKSRTTHLLRVDRSERRLRIVERGVFGLGPRRLDRSLDDLESLLVDADWTQPGGRTGGIPLSLRFQGRAKSDVAGPYRLRVGAVRTGEQVLDLVHALAAAAGLQLDRSVRTDPRELVVTLRRADGVTAGHAAAGDAARPAPLDEEPIEILPDFDPAGFASDYRVAQWEPGRRVELARPLLVGRMLGFLLFVAVLLGITWLSRLVFADKVEHAPLILFYGIYAVIAMIGGAAVTACLPRRAIVDWALGRIEVRGAFRARSLGFADVEAIELRRRVHVHRESSSGTGSSHGSPMHNRSWNEFNCEVTVLLRPSSRQARRCLLTATRLFKEAPRAPYLQAAPLAKTLAHALGVDYRFVDYE